MVSYKALNTIIEALISQTYDGVGKGDGGQTAATLEAGTSQPRDEVGNGNGGQTAAIIEAPFSQTHDGICDACISHCFRNHYVTGVFIIIRGSIVSLKSDCSRLVGCIQIVENSIYHYVMSPGRKGKT